MRLRLFGTLGVVVVALVTACSLIVDTNADQCTSNADCTGFNAVCQAGVCVGGAAAGDTGPPTDGPSSDTGGNEEAGCTPKPKSTPEDFLNEPCTSSQCIPFDDCARIGTCDGGGSLPSTIDPPPGGA